MPNMKLVVSIIQYLKEEARKESADTQESLEVAVQCLLTAYDLDPKDPRLKRNELPVSLEDIFSSALPACEDDIEEGEAAGTSGQSVNKAEIMKNLGNNLMRSNQFSEAIRYYTAAIEIDGTNAVYYCNRAAAYSKLNDFQNAVKDCEKAVAIDPKYAKAYGRMGLAYTSLEQFDSAIKAFKKASEIEPGNESYLSNMKIALEKKDKPGSSSQAGGLGGLGSVDWHTLFSNPAFRNMASTIMQDPHIISALSAGMSGSLNQTATPSTSGLSDVPPPGMNPVGGSGPSGSGGGGGNRSFDMLLEAGQYLAAQMQAANPDLVEAFRNTPRTPPMRRPSADLVDSSYRNTKSSRSPNQDKHDSAQ